MGRSRAPYLLTIPVVLVMQSCGQLELPRSSKPENEKAAPRRRPSQGQKKLTRRPPAITRVIFYNVSFCYSLSSCAWGWVRNRPRIRVCANGDRFDEFHDSFKGRT